MYVKVVIVAVVDLIVLASVYALFSIIDVSHHQVDQPLQLRFLVLLGIHGMLFVSILTIIKIEKIYTFVILILINCLLAVISITTCQLLVRPLQASPVYTFRTRDSHIQNLQIIYFNAYFILYTYALLGLVNSLLFIVVTEILIRIQEKRVNLDISRCLQKMDNGLQLSQGEESGCPICLQEMSEQGGRYIAIKVCKHVFHRKCLVQWVVLHKTCPLCRKDIFETQQSDIPQE